MITAPMCMSCKHYDRASDFYSCAAFELIPDDIIEGRIDHRQPVDNDGGIQFEQDPNMPEPDFELLDESNVGEPLPSQS